MRNMKLSTRLIAGFSLLTFLLVAVAGLAFYGLSELNAKLDEIARVNNTESRLANVLKSSIQDRAIAVRNLAFLQDHQELLGEVDRIHKQNQIYADAARQLRDMFAHETNTSDAERTLIADVDRAEALAIPPMNKAIEQALADDIATATHTIMTEARPPQRAWLAKAVELANREDDANAVAQKDAVATYRNIRTLVGSLVALAIVVAIVTAVVLTRSVLRQLGGEPSDAQQIAGQIAAGNLLVPIALTPGDEHSLMASLNAMRSNLTSIVQDIKSSAESISSAAGEIAQGNLDLSQRTEEQAASLEETAASMEELTSTVKANTDNARQGSTLAATASQTAAAGGDVVHRVIGTMEDISSSSSKVSEIIAVIESIAFQTNILALNAAVEAARAGEQGRGFAVVAGEVRTLAQRSASAAKEIKELIETSVRHVRSGSALVQDAGQTMSEVVRSVQRVTDIMGEIASASVEQSTGIEQVNVAVTQMDEVTQQNAALVEQASAAAQAMADQAASLRAAVSIFKTGGESLGAKGVAIAADVRRRVGVVGRSALGGSSVSSGSMQLAAVPSGTDWQSF
ncbi:methyl-accepting chemotaxis protein [Paraburkholderia sp. Ac-20340]|uniref:methyl-accepting chemotaxis protein n=1 Tax=Paraburkholderia sp. Ac-20340 TaxID=2703888 RepID=UPI00197FD2C9|nr:methyl-accepting chemotaxis protein [Paraburkholderia sp. Ac-20340]MBN3852262.1 methyl-accepting chemotaxis protein [Paraburkholderia sp. Ac-20340]